MGRGKVTGSGSGGGAQGAALDLREALGSTLDLRTVLQRAYPALLRLLRADAAALGVSASGRVRDFEWLVTDLPPAFFASYPEMATHDFVRAAATRSPNVVLRDQEMISRRALESNVMYHRAREVGAPLEQVMAVMLHVDRRWQSGLAVYRDRRRPFSDHDRAALRAATPALANAVRNCRLFGAAITWEAALAALLADRRAAALLLEAPAIELARTSRAAALIERWFAPHERRSGHLPAPLAAWFRVPAPVEANLEAWSRATGAPAFDTPTATWSRRGAEATLTASRRLLSGVSLTPARWLILLEEWPHVTPLPSEWRDRLTPAQQQVCTAVLQGWDNRLVASHVGCAEATVKKHLQSVFDRLGVPSRAVLIARAKLARPF